MGLLWLSTPERGAVVRTALAQALPDLPFLEDTAPDPLAVTCAVAWTCPPDLFIRHPNLRLLISVGAGVDQLDLATIPPHVQVVRMLEPGLPEQMAEYCTLATLALHRDLPAYVSQGLAGRWQPRRNRPAASTRVGVMGTGQLGRAVLAALAPFGFPLAGLSRSGTAPDGVEPFTDLGPFLSRSDILICLLPLTPGTQGILNAATFAQLPQGAALVHAGRGRQLVSGDLLAALDSGHLSGAMLDVTDPEPLPSDHALWRHPKVIVTPHIACQTRAADAARHIARALVAWRTEAEVPGLIDRRRGY